MYDTGSQGRFKTSMLRSSLCDYSDAYILAKRNITVPNTAAGGADLDHRNKKATMYNLIEYSDNYSKKSGG